MNHIGLNIRKRRELRGYTQEYMADNLGISQSAYVQIEKGQTK
ncbi:MAG: helix-turn-helix domain-containing protein [Flavobacteriales bacterium]